jgi:hypothetical protein
VIRTGGSMLSTRLLLWLCLLSLSSVSFSQERQKTSAVPETCPVTKPATQPFVPPPPYPARPSGGQFWFGTDRLWTALPKTGAWIGLGHYTPSDPTFRQKLAFWRQDLQRGKLNKLLGIPLMSQQRLHSRRSSSSPPKADWRNSARRFSFRSKAR